MSMRVELELVQYLGRGGSRDSGVGGGGSGCGGTRTIIGMSFCILTFMSSSSV